MGPKNFIYKPKTKPPLSRVKLFYQQALAALRFYHKGNQLVVLDLDEFTMKSSNEIAWKIRDMGGNRVLKRA